MLKNLLDEQIINKRAFIEELKSYGKLKVVDVDDLMNELVATGMQ